MKSILPLCCCISDWAIDNPRPVPSARPVTIGKNKVSARSSGIPSPLSIISICSTIGYDFDRIEALYNEQERLGRANPLFVHSFAEGAKPLYLHAQVLTDFSTIEELVKVFVGAERRNSQRDSISGI